MMRWLLLTCLLWSSVSTAMAEIKTRMVSYQDGDTELEGVIVWDDAQVNLDQGDRRVPGVLIVHQWMGLTDYEIGRAKQLAEMGYVAFALDIYGKGNRPQTQQAAGQQAGKFKNDRALYRQRLSLGLKQLTGFAGVRSDQVAAIGYCFGGTGVLELARSGASVSGVVSFHGGLDSPTPADGKNIQCKILICHGADDPFVPADEIEAMKAEFNSAKVDWQMNYYSGAVHSFTQSMAGNDNSRGAAYNEQADHRSWRAMQDFFGELFSGKE